MNFSFGCFWNLILPVTRVHPVFLLAWAAWLEASPKKDTGRHHCHHNHCHPHPHPHHHCHYRHHRGHPHNHHLYRKQAIFLEEQCNLGRGWNQRHRTFMRDRDADI